MKNREKYREEILSWVKNSKGNAEAYCEFTRKNMIPNLTDCTDGGCAGLTCTCCRAIFSVWLDEEYEEPPKPEVDWTKVPVDTLVRVRDREEQEWILMYFKGISDYDRAHRFMTWCDGATSKTACGGEYMMWKYCELVEVEDDGE